MPDNRSTERSRQSLDDLRHIEGFPIGEDEDLLALSDPPHYTAYPNPHIAELIEKWGKPYDEATDDYHREPYVADVSEGKSDPIYRAFPYHTKVPYKAIVPFIEHYTELGDIVLDGFCGTGMTGVAAQMVGRHAILCDLCPAATFVAYNNNAPMDAAAFEWEARRILTEVEGECGWMYETWHPHCDVPHRVRGHINYTVWSDVFLCPYCNEEIVFWDATVNLEANEVSEEAICPRCKAKVTSDEMDRSFEHIYDSALGREIERARQVPVLVNYSVGRRRHERPPDAADLALISQIEKREVPYWFPTHRMPEGDESRRNDPMGITHAYHFYTRRNLSVLAAIWDRMSKSPHRDRLAILLISILDRMSFRNRYMPQHRGNRSREVVGPLSGTLYIPILSLEVNPINYTSGKIKSTAKAMAKPRTEEYVITTQSATQLPFEESSVDYVFTDPPFGSNLMYSELNFLWETWLQVFTNTGQEAIINKTQGKALDDYRELMTRCFAEMYRVLKPGRWITVVFHNSKASVWNAIQEALARAGFLVAQVTIMDKQKGTTKQLTYPSAVKNDLIINAYKPRAGFARRFLSQAGQGLEAEFVRQHLAQLPVAANVERSKEMLYSKYLAYYVQHGYQVAYNAEQFYRALPLWGLVERDGYWFADEAQANEYEKRKVGARRASPTAQAVLFISDERSARQWLWDFLETPKTYDEIYTAFVKALQTPEDQLPEPMTMLEEGFVRTDGRWKRPDALTQAELETRRQARLLHQFEEYLEAARAGQRLKEVRKEALVAGFTEAYRAGRFQDILTVGHRLPKRLLESSPDLFDFVDIAEAKVEG